MKFLDSIEGKVQQFKNEVQEFWYNLVSSDSIKSIIDFGTKIVDIIGKIVDKIGLLGTAITGVAVAINLKAMKNGGGRVKQFTFIAKYATESFSREVYEFLCVLE